MGNNAASGMPPAKLDSGKPRVKAIGSKVLPVHLASIVADYLSDDSSDYAKAALVGVQTINLCLSQKDGSPPYKEVQSLGLVSLEHRWAPAEFSIDKQFSSRDQKSCLDFLEQTNSNYCPVTIEVLTVNLYTGKFYRAHALDDLQNTIIALQKHLESVKHVVISIHDSTCCIFSLKEAIDMVTGVPQSFDQSEALFDIIDDLKTYWTKNYLTGESVFAFYFKSSVPRKSGKYLSKFAVDSAAPFADELLKEEALHIPSSKIMWILDVNRYTHSKMLPDYTRLCRAVYWDAQHSPSSARQMCESSKDVFCFQDNPFVERIVINCLEYGRAIQLPRLSTPLADTSLRSALIELTLEGKKNTIHLTHLNNGYFPHLRHLSIIGGTITGHLDSHRVPLLTTLRMESENYYKDPLSKVGLFVQEHTQLLLRCGRPWQLVATQTNGGWSFASYEEPSANPQDESKEDSPISHSSPLALPLIKELLLVLDTQEHIDEWQSQLKGFPSLEAAADGHKDRLLVWDPQRVEKITACCRLKGMHPRFEFTEAIPEQPRILMSLTSHRMSVDVNGAAVPHLQSLEVYGGEVKLSGAFPSLQTLSLRETRLLSKWKLDASSLQSFHCYRLLYGQTLSMTPKWLPQLSSLKIWLWKYDPIHSPMIFDDEGGLGFSHVNHVVFGRNMVMSRYFDRCQANNVSDLVISVNVLHLPACWENSEWQCETLTIFIYGPTPEDSKSEESLIKVRLPSLPLVKTLTVTAEDGCIVMLDRKMPHLAVCSLPSLKSLGRSLLCPLLKRIRFTDKLSESDKKRALSRATYVAMQAQPREVIFAADYELHTMAWDPFPKKRNVLPSGRPL